MTKKERILMAMRGETPDVMPYTPRFDLWYNSNSYRGTLPERHQGRSADEIARAEGWALHKVIPELLEVVDPQENVTRGIGLYSLKENGYRIRFSPNVRLEVIKSRREDEEATRVEYHTPQGVVSTTEVINEEMRRAGVSITWVKEHAIKRPEDYAVWAFIFENITVVPDYERYRAWQGRVGEDGVAVMMGVFSASPIHHIQRDFLDATEFFFHYNDHHKEMRRLAEAIGGVYDQILKVVADSPAEAVLWGANYDDMITYPPYFEKELSPWLRKAAEVLASKGKRMICHCDGENQNLIDIIADSGMHVAEAVCCAPMTKLPIEAYYDRWCRSNKLTLMGGLIQSLLSPATASLDELDRYLDHFFAAVAPGRRIILSVADTTPPNADFDRLVRVGERVEKEGRLPLEAGALRPLSAERLTAAGERAVAASLPDETFAAVHASVLAGDDAGITLHVRALLDRGVGAKEILHRGMLSAMEVIGGRFRDGTVFIPEVLLSARAMNTALGVLEPYLAKEKKEASGRVLLGTVRGDLHDIGKNMVATMLRGVGFEVVDLGINIGVEEFVAAVEQHRPEILGMSALLTTTMPEMKKVIDLLAVRGLRGAVKVMVGGAPVNARFAREIGADGYGADAGASVDVARELLKR
ncbi:MAG: cobalamin-dependent protein [Desulfobacterales bacterium]|jgi:methylmalonyl-CoA mutase cobalamin-binding domain/chain|nr:cobalamin-dependent protein [Desulfobacterales bacterium]